MVNRSLTLPLEAIGNVCRRYGVRELAIFGSALRDEFGVESDDVVSKKGLKPVIRDAVLASAEIVYAA